MGSYMSRVIIQCDPLTCSLRPHHQFVNNSLSSLSKAHLRTMESPPYYVLVTCAECSTY